MFKDPAHLDVKAPWRKLTSNIHELNRPKAKPFRVKLANFNIPKIDLVEVLINLVEAEDLKSTDLRPSILKKLQTNWEGALRRLSSFRALGSATPVSKR